GSQGRSHPNRAHTRANATSQPKDMNRYQPRVVPVERVQEHVVQDGPSMWPTVVPIVSLIVDVVMRLLNVSLEAWCSSIQRERQARLPPITWSEFLAIFKDRFIPLSKQDDLRHQFHDLCDGTVTVTKYEAKFTDLSRGGVTIDSVPIVREFADMFPEPLMREIEFNIDLVSGTKAIYIPLYRMAPTELRELKALANQGVQIDHTLYDNFLASVVVQSSLVREAKTRQYDDPQLARLRDRVHNGGVKSCGGVLRRHGRLCIPMMVPYEGLYSLKCQSPVGWFEPGEAHLLGLEFVQQALEKVALIRERLHTTQSIQKSYVDKKVCDIEFMRGEKVFLKVSQMKGVMRFGRKGKLSPRYISPYEILDRIGVVAYRLALPLGLSVVHPVFHVSMFRRYVHDESLMIQLEDLELDENLAYEEGSISILIGKCDNGGRRR
ncbi:hypothetical protein MTR67_001472, partial [Solanum verrucosum]